MSNRSTSRPGVLDIVPAAHPGAGLVRRSGRGPADPPAGADQGDAERPRWRRRGSTAGTVAHNATGSNMADGAVGSCPSPCDEPAGGNSTDRTAQPREGLLCSPPAARPRRPWVAPAGQGALVTARWERADAICSTNASIAVKSPCHDRAGPKLAGASPRGQSRSPPVHPRNRSMATTWPGSVRGSGPVGWTRRAAGTWSGSTDPVVTGSWYPPMRCRSRVVRMSGARRC